jgi:two-component system sensor histidine kinase ResE
LDFALQDLDRLERLVQWMLRLARAEQWSSGRGRNDIGLISLTNTCEEAITRVAGLARARGIEVQLHNNGDCRVRADAEDLQVIWSNLLDNAIRHTPDQGKVELSIVHIGDRAQVRVSDHGPGIPEYEIPYIFDRFYRGDPSRARDTGGFGLGLALAKAFSEAYGGTVRLDRQVRTGTSIVVELPLCKPPVSGSEEQ